MRQTMLILLGVSTLGALLLFSFRACHSSYGTTYDDAFTIATEGFDADGQDTINADEFYSRLKGIDLQNIFFHCAATPEGFDADEAFFDRVWKWRGWANPGYHIVVRLDGSLIWMGSIAWDDIDIRNGARGYNYSSIHVSYVGGVDNKGRPKDTRTTAQKETLRNIADLLINIYPEAKIRAHYEVSNKACPSFDITDL